MGTDKKGRPQFSCMWHSGNHTLMHRHVKTHGIHTPDDCQQSTPYRWPPSPAHIATGSMFSVQLLKYPTAEAFIGGSEGDLLPLPPPPYESPRHVSGKMMPTAWGHCPALNRAALIWSPLLDFWVVFGLNKGLGCIETPVFNYILLILFYKNEWKMKKYVIADTCGKNIDVIYTSKN